jgi:hypothetical protein
MKEQLMDIAQHLASMQADQKMNGNQLNATWKLLWTTEKVSQTCRDQQRSIIVVAFTFPLAVTCGLARDHVYFDMYINYT